MSSGSFKLVHLIEDAVKSSGQFTAIDTWYSLEGMKVLVREQSDGQDYEITIKARNKPGSERKTVAGSIAARSIINVGQPSIRHSDDGTAAREERE